MTIRGSHIAGSVISSLVAVCLLIGLFTVRRIIAQNLHQSPQSPQKRAKFLIVWLISQSIGLCVLLVLFIISIFLLTINFERVFFGADLASAEVTSDERKNIEDAIATGKILSAGLLISSIVIFFFALWFLIVVFEAKNEMTDIERNSSFNVRLLHPAKSVASSPAMSAARAYDVPHKPNRVVINDRRKEL